MRRTSSLSSLSSSSSDSEDTMQIFVKTVSGTNSTFCPYRANSESRNHTYYTTTVFELHKETSTLTIMCYSNPPHNPRKHLNKHPPLPPRPPHQHAPRRPAHSPRRQAPFLARHYPLRVRHRAQLNAAHGAAAAWRHAAQEDPLLVQRLQG